MKLSGSDKKNKIFFSAIFVVSFLLSASVMPYLRAPVVGGNGRVTADLVFCVCIVCGILYEDRKAVSIMALVAGITCDIFIMPPMHLSPVLFLVGAYFARNAVNIFTSVNAVTAAMASVPFFIMRGAAGCIHLMHKNSDVGFISVMKLTVLPEFACNVVAVLFVYIIVNFLYKRAKRRFYF